MLGPLGWNRILTSLLNRDNDNNDNDNMVFYNNIISNINTNNNYINNDNNNNNANDNVNNSITYNCIIVINDNNHTMNDNDILFDNAGRAAQARETNSSLSSSSSR